MNTICTICVRGNSKGIKNKNLLKIKKKTLINITFDQAKKSKIFDKIILTTDSVKIKKSCNKLKFDYEILRPKNLASDNSGKIDTIKHALFSTEKYFNKKFDYIVDLDVTSPLRNSDDITSSFNKFRKFKANNLITICDSKKNPYFNMIEFKRNHLKLICNTKQFKTRQHAPKVFDMNASIYIWKRESLLKNKLFNKKTIAYKMNSERSIDIDSYFDYKLVKYLYEK